MCDCEGGVDRVARLRKFRRDPLAKRGPRPIIRRERICASKGLLQDFWRDRACLKVDIGKGLTARSRVIPHRLSS